jgi:hypothetical protein
MPGRYLYPAVAPAIVLLVAGAWAFRPDSWRGLAPAAGLALVSAAGMAGLLFGSPSQWREPDREGPSAVSAAYPVDLAGSFDGFQLTVDEVAYDRAKETAWLHVVARNRGELPAEWSGTPAVFLPDGARVDPSYSRTTGMAGALAPAQVTSGWIDLGVNPARLLGQGPTVLIFDNIATRDYRQVGSIALAFSSSVSVSAEP